MNTRIENAATAYVATSSAGTLTQPAPNPGTSSRGQWITAIAAVLVIVLLSALAVVMLLQANKLVADSASLPARFQADYAATARSSWIAGVAAAVGVVLNIVGLVFVRKKKLLVPIGFLAISVIGMIAIAMLFKPA